MKEIDLSKPSYARRTVLAYGHTRSGKTHFAATAPRPLFLADATESGWNTIADMDPSFFWEPERKPLVWAIEKMPDMAEAFVRSIPLIESGAVRTVVVDSLTFYSDLYLAGLINMMSTNGKEADTRQVYGALGNHLRDLRVKWHGLPCNVIWLCLAKEPEKETEEGGPLVPGQQAKKFAAGCDNILYCRNAFVGGKHTFEVRTKKFGQYITGGREGSRDVVDPLPQPTFKAFLSAIGAPVQSVDAPLPKINIINAPSKPAATTSSPAQPRVVRGPVRRNASTGG